MTDCNHASPPHLLSLGAGVQSSTLALMAAAGEVEPMPLAAIFADTEAEPDSVYRWLEWLEKELPYPVYRVTAGNLEADVLTMRVSAKGRKYSRTAIPVFTRNVDGSLGRVPHRTCTRDYKIRPLMKKARQLAGIKRGQKTVGVIQWIGISLDEYTRAKPSRDPWCESRFPLLEKRMSRNACLDWMQAHGYPEPPRSACWFCPFHSLAEWKRLRDDEPKHWQQAIDFERALQAAKAASENFSAEPYLHRSCVPLAEIDLRTDADHGQLMLWQNECEGMCGV